jgi:small subunit ribosomal protein S5
VSYGYGRGGEVPVSVEKAVKNTPRHSISAPLAGKTIPHQVEGRYGSSRVLLIPAAPGTGVIAGASVRAVLEAAGIHDILTKARGSTNPINLVKATLNGLQKLRTREQVARLRGVEL